MTEKERSQFCWHMQGFDLSGSPETKGCFTAAGDKCPLLAARDELGLNDCTIVTWDSQHETEDGVKAGSVWQWCLR